MLQCVAHLRVLQEIHHTASVRLSAAHTMTFVFCYGLKRIPWKCPMPDVLFTDNN